MNEILDREEGGKQPFIKFKYVIALFILGWIIGLFGALFKIQSWVGGAELLTIGTLVKVLSGVVVIVKLLSNKDFRSFLNS